MSPDGQDGEDAESPMPNPSQISQTVRRRGAISAEPITEEDVATYVKKVLKLNFDTKKTNTFTSFSSKFFMTIFLVKSKLSTAKKSKTTTFSRVFHPKNRQFSREIKVEFLDKK